MNAGKLSEAITVLRAVSTSDEYGGDIINYQPVINTKANVFIAKQDREFANMAESFPSIVTFQVRLYHDIKEADQIEWLGRKHRILSVFSDKRRQMVEVKTELIKE